MSQWRVAAEFARTRLRARRGESLLSMVGIAIAVSGLVVLLLLPAIAGELVLRRTLDQLDPSERAVTVVVAPEGRPDPSQLAAIDHKLRSRFEGSGLDALRRTVEFRALAARDGSVFRLGGVESFASALRIVEGRAPATCSPARCEVVSVGGTAVRGAMRQPTPELVVVGRAIRTDPVPFSGGLAPEKGEQLLVADTVSGLAQLRSLELIRRVYAWVAPIDAQRITRASVKPLLARLAAAGGDVDLPGYLVSAPDDAINAALARADTSGRRLALPAAELFVLLAGVVMLVAFARRRGHQLAIARLERRGADSGATVAFSLATALRLVAFGGLLGLATGGIVGAVLAHAARLSLWTTVRRSVHPSSVGALGAVVVFLWLLLGALLHATDPIPSGRSRKASAADLIGVASVGMVALLARSGDRNGSSLASSLDPTLWAMPMFVAVVVVCAVVRVVPLLLMAAGRLFRGRRVLTRVALVDATRAPLRPLMTAATVAVAVAFGTFGIGYRSTLERGASEQATFAVPYDATLSVGSALTRPNELRPTGGWATLGGTAGSATIATDVLRRSATIRRTGSNSDIVDVLGLDPRTMSAMRARRGDFGPPPSQLARLLAVAAPALIGTLLPADARRLTLEVGGAKSGVDEVTIAVILERVDGTWHETEAPWSFDSSVASASAPLERGDAGGRFIGLRISQPSETAKHQEHHAGEGRGTAVGATSTTLEIRHIRAAGSGAPVDLVLRADSITSRAATVTALPSGGVRVSVALQGTSALLVPRAVRQAIPALVDPLTASAATNGVLVAETQGQTFEFRVAAVANRFPTLGSRFVVADGAVVGQRFNLAQPAYGTPTEVWLAASSQSGGRALYRALRRPPFDQLALDQRADRLADIRNDPLSRVSLGVLVGSALLAGLLAAAALLLSAASERSDDEAFHRALLLEGATPRTIRRFVWIRTIALAGAALPVGLVAGSWLVSLIVRVVRLTADAIAPEPGLVLSVPWASLVVALSFVAILFCVATAAGTRLARPRAGQDLLRGQS